MFGKDGHIKKFGGEMESFGGETDSRTVFFTDSGRSSLRLILDSDAARGKKFILPDFLCGVITDVFEEKGVDFGFYRIKEDLTIDTESVKGDYDAAYVIDYFGSESSGIDYFRAEKSAVRLFREDTLIIEDRVFCPRTENTGDWKNWAGFNSLRKISRCPAGSVLIATFPLRREEALAGEPPFAGLKREGRRLKKEWISGAGVREPDFLNLLKEGEDAIDAQTAVYQASPKITDEINRFHEWLGRGAGVEIRRKNISVLRNELGEFEIPLPCLDFPCFFVMRCHRRDALRKKLAEEGIYLPVHWPAPARFSGPDRNPLYNRIISIPVDERWTEGDMALVAAKVKTALGQI